MRIVLCACALAIPIIASSKGQATAQARPVAAPGDAAASLLAADRDFGASAAARPATDALIAMFSPDVIMPTPDGTFARGIDAVRATLDANPANRDAHLGWSPIRAGVSADGTHGFTAGYMTMTRADGAVTPLKYMAYWTRTGGAWRVAAYKRARTVDTGMATPAMASLVPATSQPLVRDPALLARHRSSLVAAESTFSAEAGKVGLGAAFARFGSPDAINFGAPTARAFLVGADAIAAVVGASSVGEPSPLAWAADETALVASSGDLGVTLGFIRRVGSPAAAVGSSSTKGAPFFTIWYRTSALAPWHYVAE